MKMNKTLRVVLIVIAGLVVAAAGFFAGQAFARWRSSTTTAGVWPRPMMGFGWRDRFAPDFRRHGPGMGWGYRRAPVTSPLEPLSEDQARQAAEAYIQATGLSGLSIAEVMIFDNHAYVAVKETDSGMGAFELLVDPLSKSAYPEPGPNMMWNLKYAAINHSHMMGGRRPRMMWWGQGTPSPADVSAQMPVTQDEAAQIAQQYLDQYMPGAKVESPGMAFYGYYTFDFEKDGKIVGMLSVNGFDKAVFLHTWHGNFLSMSE
jgi:hypothetical protein